MKFPFGVLLLGWWLAGVLTPGVRAEDVDIPDTQVHEFTSAITNRRYQLRIGLPRNYDPTNRRYPVVYQLDDQWDFDRVFPLARAMEWDRRLEPVIVAAITYGGVNPDYGALRQRDYTPTPYYGVGQSGDAAKFLEVVRTEIIPRVESTYACRTDERVLMGSSFGGLFTCYALVHAPELFSGYVASSPSVWFDNQIIVQQLQAAGPLLAGRKLRVRIITGANEAYTQRFGAQVFYDTLVGMRLPLLDVGLSFATDERHGAVATVAYDDGLPAVLAPKLAMFAVGPGEPTNWTAATPPVTFQPDRVQRFAGPFPAVERRAMVFEPSGGTTATNVRGIAYVFDAQWDQRFVDASYGGMIYDVDLATMLRVGVDWVGDWNTITDARNRDFTPTDPSGTGAFGGATAFRSAVRTQILPGAEKALTAAPGFRLLLASEKGALWALTDLLGDKPTFDRYLLAAPAAEWDLDWLLQLEATRAGRGGSLNAKILLYYGDRDAQPGRVAAIERFVQQLTTRGYPGLDFQAVRLSGKGYAETKLYGFHKGLRLLAL